ncbi:MAG: S41 family peptidase [Alistipes sp.]|nr:S41 family peptidase [Alistipes senegalensis]MCM1250425.1 S41 family peptidase [Alistipes sp.]
MRQLFVFFVFLFGSGMQAHGQSPAAGGGMDPLQKFFQLYRYLDRFYIDEIDAETVIGGAVEGMLGQLDPHSAYIPAEEMQGVDASFDGEFSGIGIEFDILRDTLIVVNTVSGGPAERVGMLPDDRIVRIDTLDAVGLSRAEVPRCLRGKRGSKVGVDVVRHGEPAPLHFVVERDRIPLHTIDAAYSDDGIGYVKVNRFGRTTMNEFREAYRTLGRPRRLILDLRGNVGGLLEQAIEMAGFFLPRGARIVSTEGRAVSEVSYTASSDGEALGCELVVLIDEGSASASEIVAGAVQDWDRGVLVGRPSFGKGLVQRQVRFDDGSAARITVARYHTPSGRVIQRPYENGERRKYYLDHLRRYDDAVRDSLDAATPVFRTLRAGRIVHGDGGIRPDILVEADTAGYSPYYAELIRRGVVGDYALSFLERERAQLQEAYPAEELFVADYEVDDTLLRELTALGEQRGIAFVEEDFARSAPRMRVQLKALIARRLFGTGAYYRIVNPLSGEAYSRAVALLRDWDRLGRPLLEGD